MCRYHEHVTLLTLLLTIGATARLTRLVTADKITEQARDWVLDRINPEGMLTYLMSCAWCSSIYVGAAVAATSYWWAESPYWYTPAAALTASYVAGLLADVAGLPAGREE